MMGRISPTLFTKLFRGEESESLTFDELRDAAQSYIVAGSDTTANTLTYLIWSVCKNPQIRDQLAREVQSVPPGVRGPRPMGPAVPQPGD